MIRTVVTTSRKFIGTVTNYSIGLFYAQWSHRYLLYFAAFLLFAVWTNIALEVYGWLTRKGATIRFGGPYSLHTMMNFGLCFYVADEWLVRLTGRWGRFENRTLGKQALIWGMSFVAAFIVQRTIVFKEIQYYCLDLYHYYEKYPMMRPHPLDHFLFCVPYFFGTIVLLCLIAFIRQHGLKKERDVLLSKEMALVAKEETLQEKMSTQENERKNRPLLLQSGSNQILLDQEIISHITVEDHYCHIHTLEEDGVKSHFIKSSLTDLLEKLPDSHFIQIHRSHVVNTQAIRQLVKKSRTCQVHLKSDVVLPVSRHRLNEVKARLHKKLC